MENKTNKLLLKLIDRDIELILDNQAEIKFSFDLYVDGFQDYKDVWSLHFCKEGLECSHKKENKTYEFAIAVYRNDPFWRIIAGHVPMHISKVLVNSFTTTKFLPHLQGYWEARKQRNG